MPPAFNIYYFFDRNGPGETVHAFPQGLRVCIPIGIIKRVLD